MDANAVSLCVKYEYEARILTIPPTPTAVTRQTGKNQSQANIQIDLEQGTENEKTLCSHCQRTATNGIKCKGICVADNDY